MRRVGRLARRRLLALCEGVARAWRDERPEHVDEGLALALGLEEVVVCALVEVEAQELRRRPLERVVAGSRSCAPSPTARPGTAAARPPPRPPPPGSASGWRGRAARRRTRRRRRRRRRRRSASISSSRSRASTCARRRPLIVLHRLDVRDGEDGRHAVVRVALALPVDEIVDERARVVDRFLEVVDHLARVAARRAAAGAAASAVLVVLLEDTQRTGRAAEARAAAGCAGATPPSRRWRRPPWAAAWRLPRRLHRRQLLLSGARRVEPGELRAVNSSS